MGKIYSIKGYKTNPAYKEMLVYNSKSYINPVARAYFDKVSAAGGDVQDKASINNFVNGLCSIVPPQLWICWPLRSSQSVGSGTVAPSLGGLGNFNGTLTAGPTWGGDGITFTSASSQRIVFSNTESAFSTSGSPFSVFALVNSTGSLNSGSTVFSRGANGAFSTFSWALRHTSGLRAETQVTNGTTQVIPASANSSAPLNTNNFLIGSYNKIQATAQVNTGTIATAAYTENLNSVSANISIGSALTQNHYNGTIGFVMFVYSANIANSVYNIYKNTLGWGLSLS